MTDSEPPKKKRSTLRWAFHGLLFSMVGLVAVLAFNAYRFESRQLSLAPVELPELDQKKLSARLSGAIKFRSVSAEGMPKSGPRFIALHAYLRRSFPALHKTLKREVVGKYSLLYEWQGSDPSLEPLLLVGHLDVATVPRGTDLSWTRKPFEGAIHQEMIWGRGALDDKSGSLAMLEAVEHLLEQGHQPKRSVVLAFSHDALRGGTAGSQALASKLSGRRFDSIMSEGLTIVTGFVPEIQKPIALVGIAERGHATLLIEPKTAGDADAATKAQELLLKSPMPAVLEGAALDQFDYLASEFPTSIRLALANRWLFSSMIQGRIESQPGSEVLIRSTPSGQKLPPWLDEKKVLGKKVLQNKAARIVNFRLRPGDSLADLQKFATSVVADAPVSVKILPGAFPGSKVSPVAAPQFKRLHTVLAEVFPETVVAPSLVVGSSDARRYQSLSDNVYRFRPLRLRQEDIMRIRGEDERISVADYLGGVQFYLRLLQAQDP